MEIYNWCGSGYSFNFTIDYNLIYGGVTPGDEIEYFIVAQGHLTKHLLVRTCFQRNIPGILLLPHF
jgi:hypothetical protein